MSAVSTFCDAVVTAINAGTYTNFHVTAVLDYALTVERENIDGVLCTVTPAALGVMAEPELLDGTNREEMAFVLSIQKECDGRDKDAVEAMLDLVQSIWHEIETRLAAISYTRIERDADPIYEIELLRDAGVFLSNTAFSFWAYRAE